MPFYCVYDVYWFWKIVLIFNKNGLISDEMDQLEKKMAALELQILTTQESENAPAQTPAQPTGIDMPNKMTTLITAASSAKEIFVTVLNRLLELNQYVESNPQQNNLNLRSKREIIKAIYPDVKKCGECVHRLKSMVPVALNCPSSVPNQQMHEGNQEVPAGNAQAVHQYQMIIDSISNTYLQIEDIVTQFEMNMMKNLSSE